jgi:hypothetical protein
MRQADGSQASALLPVELELPVREHASNVDDAGRAVDVAALEGQPFRTAQPRQSDKRGIAAKVGESTNRKFLPGQAGFGGTSRTAVAVPSSKSPWMSSTNACGSSKRVPGSRPATLRTSRSPCTRPSIHLAHTS